MRKNSMGFVNMQIRVWGSFTAILRFFGGYQFVLNPTKQKFLQINPTKNIKKFSIYWPGIFQNFKTPCLNFDKSIIPSKFNFDKN